MQFLTPLFWLGVLTVAVPLFLHLTRRETKSPVFFPSLMFLQRIPVHEFRRRRLTNILLLCLRCLAITFIVAAFAQPVLEVGLLGSQGPFGARSVAVLMDRSFSMSSMQVRRETEAAASEVIRSLGAGDEAVVIGFGKTTSALTGWESNETRLLTAIERGLETPSFEATSYSEALRAAAEQLEDARNPNKQVYLITDLQSSGLDLSAETTLPPGVSFTVKNVADQRTNLYLSELNLQREYFSVTKTPPILVRIESSPPAAFSGEVKLFLRDSLLARQTFEIGAEGSGTVTLPPVEVPSEVTPGRVVLEASDALPDDNTFYFVLEKKEPGLVFVQTSGDPSRARYFEEALASGSNLPFEPVVGSRPFEPGSASVLTLLDLSAPPAASSIRSHLDAGGGLIVALGAAVNPEAYNRELPDILPGEIMERVYSRGSGSTFHSILSGEWAHPVFGVFQSGQRAALMSVQFYSFWRLRPRDGAMVLARFDNGDPALIEGKSGAGTVLLFASTFDRVWTDFPLRTSFVPFCQQLTSYVSDWSPAVAALTVNQAFPMDDWVKDGDDQSNVDLLDPNGRRLLALGAERPEFVVVEVPGFYEVRSQKRTDWIAVNTDRAESDLKRVSEGEFQAALRTSQEAIPQGPHGTLEATAPQQALWWLFLFAALLVLLVESLLANRVRRNP